MRETVLEKALSTLAGEGGEFLPDPLSARFCDHVYDGSELLSLIPKTPMNTKTLKIPTITNKMQVYWQSLEKSEPPRSAFETSSKELDAETWMCWVDFSDQLRDDIKAGPFTIERLLALQYAKAMAYYTELAIVLGNTAHATTTATDPGNAGETWYLNNTWYNRDPRLMWDGIYTLALASGVSFTATYANSVLAFTNDDVQANTTSPARMSPMVVDYAVYRLGKYRRKGVRSRSELIFIMHPCSKMQLENAMQVKTIDKFGANATIVKGEVDTVAGVPIVATPFIPCGYAVMTYRDNLIFGDRQRIRVEDERVPRELGTNKVVSMRGDFLVCHEDALVLVTGLDTCAEAS